MVVWSCKRSLTESQGMPQPCLQIQPMVLVYEPKRYARFDNMSALYMALAASIHVGTIVEATQVSIDLDIVTTACLAPSVCMYDWIRIHNAGSHA